MVINKTLGTVTEVTSLWQDNLGKPVTHKIATKRLHEVGFKPNKSKR